MWPEMGRATQYEMVILHLFDWPHPEGRICISGGIRSSDPFEMRDFHSFDLSNKARTLLPFMYVDRYNHATVVTEKYLYALGGTRRSERCVAACERYSWADER